MKKNQASKPKIISKRKRPADTRTLSINESGRVTDKNNFYHLFLFEDKIKNRASFNRLMAQMGFMKIHNIQTQKVWDRIFRDGEHLERARDEIIKYLQPNELLIAIPVRDTDYGKWAFLGAYIPKK